MISMHLVYDIDHTFQYSVGPATYHGAYFPRNLERAEALASKINKARGVRPKGMDLVVYQSDNRLYLVRGYSDRVSNIRVSIPEDVVVTDGQWMTWIEDTNSIHSGKLSVGKSHPWRHRQVETIANEVFENIRDYPVEWVDRFQSMTVSRKTKTLGTVDVVLADDPNMLHSIAHVIEHDTRRGVYVFERHIEYFSGTTHRTINHGEMFRRAACSTILMSDLVGEEHYRPMPFDELLRASMNRAAAEGATPLTAWPTTFQPVNVGKLFGPLNYEAEDTAWVALWDRILGYRKSERKLRELKRTLDAAVPKEDDRQIRESPTWDRIKEANLRELKRFLYGESSEPSDVLSAVARHLAESVSEHVGPVGSGLKNAQYSFETRDDTRNNMITIAVNVTHSDE